MNNKSGGGSGSNVGQELTKRLGRFVEKLEKTSSVADIPKLVTVRRVKLDLRPRPFSGGELQSIRRSLGVSQAVLAEYLGVSVSTIRDWEQGRTEVSGPVCRLLAEMNKDIAGWSHQLKQLATVEHSHGGSRS